MKVAFDKHRDIWGPLFTAQIRNWAETVFRPADVMIANGQLSQEEWGEAPMPVRPVGGTGFSEKGLRLHPLRQLPADYERVRYFDFAAAEYEMGIHEYKAYIIKHAFPVLERYLMPGSRVMDCACGPGYEAIALSMMVAESEVVAVDLSTEMVRLACHNAKEHGRHNMSFYQGDARNLPGALKNKFDAVYCQLSCSYFDDLSRVATCMFDALHNSGFVFLTEPYPTTPNSLSINFAKAANPWFERLYDKEELQAIFMDAGFKNYYWKEILPGIGLSIISKQ